MFKLNKDAFCRVVAALVEGPCTIEELMDATGLHRQTMYDLMIAMKRHKLVHICAWDKDSRGRDAIRVFGWGHGRDKPRSRLTRAQIAQNYRARKRQKELNQTLAGAA